MLIIDDETDNRQLLSKLFTPLPEELQKERKRICNRQKRFRTHTRSATQSQKQLEQLVAQWKEL